jgi:hypothetical protein
LCRLAVWPTLIFIRRRWRSADPIGKRKVLQILGKYLTETVLNWISIILLCIISVACTNDESPLIAIRADTEQTIAGGNPITLSALSLAKAELVIWCIDEGSPGKLDSDSGSMVRYLPPAAGSIAHPASITVSATAHGVTRSIQLNVQPSSPALLNVFADDPERLDRDVLI